MNSNDEIIYLPDGITILNSIPIHLEKSKECYECESNKKTGSKIFCKRCNESHFVCKDCIPIYLKYEPESNYLKNEYSELTIKESR